MPNITVNPTRMELTRLKGKLRTAQRGHKLLKDKRDELMKQFLDTVREVRALRREVEEELMTVHGAFTVASALMSSQALEQALQGAPEGKAAPAGQRPITYTDLYEWGISGTPDSANRRRAVLKQLDLPPRLSKKELLQVLNTLYTYESLQRLLQGEKEEDHP